MLVYEKCIQKFRSSYAFTMLCQQLCGNLKLHKCIWLKICCTSTWSSLAVTGCWWHHVRSRVKSGTTNTPFNTWFISSEILCIKWTVNVGYLLGVSWITLLGFQCKMWMYSSYTWAFLAVLQSLGFTVGFKLNRGVKTPCHVGWWFNSVALCGVVFKFGYNLM